LISLWPKIPAASVADTVDPDPIDKRGPDASVSSRYSSNSLSLNSPSLDVQYDSVNDEFASNSCSE
jgi:hypothetical protein